MRDGIGQGGGYDVHLDLQDVLVIDVEDLGDEPGADRVGLARVPVNKHLHRTPPFLRPTVVP